jgi:hypothetical protein
MGAFTNYQKKKNHTVGETMVAIAVIKLGNIGLRSASFHFSQFIYHNTYVKIKKSAQAATIRRFKESVALYFIQAAHRL